MSIKKISLMFVPNVPINNIPTLVQIIAWRQPGDKQLSELMMIRLPYMCHWASMRLCQTKLEKFGHFCTFVAEIYCHAHFTAISGFLAYNTTFNLLRQSDTYMLQSNRPSLVHITAWCMFSTKPLSEPMLAYFQLGIKKHITKTFYLKFKALVQENAFENVICKIKALLSQP